MKYGILNKLYLIIILKKDIKLSTNLKLCKIYIIIKMKKYYSIIFVEYKKRLLVFISFNILELF